MLDNRILRNFLEKRVLGGLAIDQYFLTQQTTKKWNRNRVSESPLRFFTQKLHMAQLVNDLNIDSQLFSSYPMDSISQLLSVMNRSSG